MFIKNKKKLIKIAYENWMVGDLWVSEWFNNKTFLFKAIKKPT